MIFQNEKTSFKAIKTTSPKRRKIDIFPKGLTHGFGPKMAIFPFFFFQAIQARKISLTIFQNVKTPCQATKTTSSKSRKIDIFPKGLPMVLVQKWPFFQLVFFKKYRQGKCLLRYSRTKNAILGYKNKKFKKSKIDIFPKGLPWFWSKNGHFSNLFYLGNIGEENVFYDILERKNAFVGYKIRNFKNSKN